ncbi:hypothetical protein TBLA_0G00550 [Henningerozyma blattae CBS 6284]|uniref:Mediator of RNA polymerase II transcription subunit 4 n=1 Tax=Henningerozyma blattae (strain ATCC 34711 / CBS 6284 / DSM 70876 / NBRC 10599 / NRRL Y-10934 / UCD 77-7) TaxID=1071380 RepID=I2H6K2_HENB6|nr:hypothetical protein TBLA_0G00550 [Tetrapisispora blattae CBS 6284]CCH62004.1 hypothetical protein TBLA_0G00550 [Tetrapisispora blattae CBS 6284]
MSDFHNTLPHHGHHKTLSTSISEGDVLQDNNDKNDELSKIQTYNDLIQYEETLSKLSSSVDKYKPDLQYAYDLIDIDRKLYSTLDSFVKYDEISTKLKKLEIDTKALDEKTKSVLDSLNDCHELLNTLPMLEQVEFEKNTMLKQREKINSKVLLDYATKLAKFTKIPPTFNKNTLGPNNFIWPAEDALRRGMLAVASAHTEELTALPGSVGDEENSKDISQLNADDVTNKDNHMDMDITVEGQDRFRRGSFTFGSLDASPKRFELSNDNAANYNSNNNSNSNNSRTNDPNTGAQNGKEENNEEDAMDLDLDLFDPDEF